MHTLTEKEAYAAMYKFLDNVYDRTQSDTLGSLLGDMSTLEELLLRLKKSRVFAKNIK